MTSLLTLQSPRSLYSFCWLAYGRPQCALPRFYFWEDIINAVGEPGAPDAAFRDRRQVSCQAAHALDGSNLVLRK